MAALRRYLGRHWLGLIVLVLAFGGTAYAAGKIGPKRIKANAVKERHIAPNSVFDSEANERSFGVIHPGARVDINDPQNDGNAFTFRPLFRFGPFELTASCRDLGSFNHDVTITSSTPAHATGTTSSQVSTTPVMLSGSETLNANAMNLKAVSIHTPGGRFMSVTVVEVNRPQNNTNADCAFWVFGRGR